VVFWFSFDIKREQSALMKERSGPRGAQSHLTAREKTAPRHRRANLLKEKTSPALWPARSAKPFDQKKKHPPRHRRASHLKEKTNPAATPHQVVITDPQERKRVSSE
jgi:hypothetical protein